MELKECLMHDLQEKKRAYETYRHSMELGSGGMRVLARCRPCLCADLRVDLQTNWYSDSVQCTYMLALL